MYGLEVRIARIFNTYGPRMQFDDGRVVTNLVHQALTGEPLTLYGDGTQTRSFCYVDDEVTGLLALLDGRSSTPVNIGNPHEVTMRELATLVLELTGSTSTDRQHAAAERRSARAATRHLARPRRAGLGAGHRPARQGSTRTIDHHRAAMHALIRIGALGFSRAGARTRSSICLTAAIVALDASE